jgi:hypothetical protein
LEASEEDLEDLVEEDLDSQEVEEDREGNNNKEAEKYTHLVSVEDNKE